MININTMNELEKLHIGSDVDKLENYLALINYSELMGNCIVCKEDKEKIVELLEDIKKNSELFKYTWDMNKRAIDEFDRLYEKYGKFITNSIADISEECVKRFTREIVNPRDIFAVALPDGIDIRIIYRNGLYYKAFTYYKNSKGLDITEHIKYLVPYNIQEITDSGLIELQARLSMNNTSMNEIGINEADKMYFIVNYISHEFSMDDTDKFCVKVYKMYCEDNEAMMDTLWNEYELLEETELDIAEHAIIRDIDRADVIDAIYELQEYFDNLKDRDYIYTDIIVCMNNEPENERITVCKKQIKKEIYKSTVQNIKWVSGRFSQKPRIEIKPTMTRYGDTIKYLDLDNLDIIYKKGITKGKEINFEIDYKGEIKLINQ